MGTEAIRRGLRAAEQAARAYDHPGLALQRCLVEHADAEQKRRGQRPEVELLRKAAGSPASDAYRRAFARWKGIAEARPGCCAFPGTLAGPLAVGLGNASPLEIGLTLHHTYGMPLVPGSALKGLCRRAAIRLQAQGELSAAQFAVLFGDDRAGTRAASHLVFWDAWYDPGSVDGRPLKRDVITVHHPEYYARRGAGAWPADFDDPTPVPFLVARPGARFLFALDAPGPGWGEFAERLLRHGLEELGAGGKTNSGYGQLRFEPYRSRPREEVWPDCRLTQRVVKGAVELVVRSDRGELTLPQREWEPVRAGLTGEQREATKKSGLRAAVRVRREGDAFRFVAVEMWLEEGR